MDGCKIQGFSPKRIETITPGNVDTSLWVAFCFPADDVTYQINGAGPTATLSAGTIRVVRDSIDSITFSGFVSASCEIM